MLTDASNSIQTTAAITVRLMKYTNDGSLEEVQADGYSPVQANEWRFSESGLEIENATSIVFPPARDWGDVHAVRLERNDDTFDIELDSAVVLNRRLTRPKQAMFEPGELSIRF